jgi:hypothetical protein
MGDNYDISDEGGIYSYSAHMIAYLKCRSCKRVTYTRLERVTQKWSVPTQTADGAEWKEVVTYKRDTPLKCVGCGVMFKRSEEFAK